MGWLPTPRPRHPSAPEARTSGVAEVQLHVKIAILFSGVHGASKHRASKSPHCTRRNDTSKARRFRGRAFTVFQSRDTPRPYSPVGRTSLARVWLGLLVG